jgi:hypothetical protein
MSDAFDGAGKPYKGPSFRAGIIILVGVVIAVIVIWNLAGWGMDLLNIDGPVDNPPRLPGAGQ